jgi:nucleoside-diphosphate-sugar epimerase
MKVLVVGGSGFIGTRLISDWRAAGHEIVNLDLRHSRTHDEVTVIGDVRDAGAVRAAAVGCAAIVLLAAEHRDDVRPISLYEQVNVGGARVVAEVAASTGIERIVFTSSVAVYGLDKGCPSEDREPEPFNEYGRTKLAAERVLQTWVQGDPARTLFIVRPCVIFGERNRGNVYSLARQIATGRFLFIGTGANRKSMGYVGNVVAFLAGGLTAAPGAHLTNFADSPDLSTRELVDLIHDHLGRRRRPAIPRPIGLAAGYAFDGAARLTGRSFPISAVRVRKFCAETQVDTARLQASGFRAPTPLREALARTLAAEFPGGRVPEGSSADDGVFGAGQ